MNKRILYSLSPCKTEQDMNKLNIKVLDHTALLFAQEVYV